MFKRTQKSPAQGARGALRARSVGGLGAHEAKTAASPALFLGRPESLDTAEFTSEVKAPAGKDIPRR